MTGASLAVFLCGNALMCCKTLAYARTTRRFCYCKIAAAFGRCVCKAAPPASLLTPILLSQNCRGIRQMSLQAASLASLLTQTPFGQFAKDSKHCLRIYAGGQTFIFPLREI